MWYLLYLDALVETTTCTCYSRSSFYSLSFSLSPHNVDLYCLNLSLFLYLKSMFQPNGSTFKFTKGPINIPTRSFFNICHLPISYMFSTFRRTCIFSCPDSSGNSTLNPPCHWLPFRPQTEQLNCTLLLSDLWDAPLFPTDCGQWGYQQCFIE